MHATLKVATFLFVYVHCFPPFLNNKITQKTRCKHLWLAAAHKSGVKADFSNMVAVKDPAKEPFHS